MSDPPMRDRVAHPEGDVITVPLAEETVTVEKRRVEKGRVVIHKTVTEREEVVEQTLDREMVEVTRVPVNRVVEQPPAPRQEGDLLIVPLFEEVVVVEKRLLIREELHIRKRTVSETVRQPVTLRSEQVAVERRPASRSRPTAARTQTTE